MIFQESLSIVVNIIVLLAPFVLLKLAYVAWINYRRLKFQYELDGKLVELRLPAEIHKSPRAMEILFSSLYQKNDGTLWEVFVEGSQRPHFSLEIASKAGEVRFFIWTPKEKYLTLIKNNLYSQYPGLEILDVPADDDYINTLSWNPQEHVMWGTYWRLKDDDPKPIVTYKSYELEKDPDEEYKIDPFVSVVEYLGGVGYGEEAYLQFLIRAEASDEWRGGNTFRETKDHKKKMDDYIEKLKEDNTSSRTIASNDDEADDSEVKITNYAPGVVDSIKKMRDLQDKFYFQTIIRGLYVAKNESFNSGNISGMIGTMQQFSHTGGNVFKLAKYTDLTDNQKDVLAVLRFKSLVNYGQKVRDKLEKDFLAAFKRRSGFYPPHKGNLGSTKPMPFSTEELATLYHLPGSGANSPSLTRIGARKSDPPSNLPF